MTEINVRMRKNSTGGECAGECCLARASCAIQHSDVHEKARRNVRALVKGYLFDAAIRRSASGLRQMHSVRDWRSLTWPDP